MLLAQLPEPAPLAWPQIEGIDIADVTARLRGNQDLFVSLLARLLDEFADVGSPQPSAETAPALQQARLHKLKGSASMLGAHAIAQLAAAAEQACAAGEMRQVQELGAQLFTALTALREQAGVLLQATRTQRQIVILPSDEALEPLLVGELVHLLRQQDLSARQRFNALAPGLRRLMGALRYDSCRSQIDQLQFADAADALEDCSRAQLVR